MNVEPLRRAGLLNVHETSWENLASRRKTAKVTYCTSIFCLKNKTRAKIKVSDEYVSVCPECGSSAYLVYGNKVSHVEC